MSIGETVCTSTIMVLCEIRDSHGSVAEDSGILGCHAAFPIVEGSHRPNDVQNEYSMSFNQNNTSSKVSRKLNTFAASYLNTQQH